MPIKADNGWRAFFALLMVLQTIAIGAIWRTYDAVNDLKTKAVQTEIRLNEQVFPKLRELEERTKPKAAQFVP